MGGLAAEKPDGGVGLWGALCGPAAELAWRWGLQRERGGKATQGRTEGCGRRGPGGPPGAYWTPQLPPVCPLSPEAPKGCPTHFTDAETEAQGREGSQGPRLRERSLWGWNPDYRTVEHRAPASFLGRGTLVQRGAGACQGHTGGCPCPSLGLSAGACGPSPPQARPLQPDASPESWVDTVSGQGGVRCRGPAPGVGEKAGWGKFSRTNRGTRPAPPATDN